MIKKESPSICSVRVPLFTNTLLTFNYMNAMGFIVKNSSLFRSCWGVITTSTNLLRAIILSSSIWSIEVGKALKSVFVCWVNCGLYLLFGSAFVMLFATYSLPTLSNMIFFFPLPGLFLLTAFQYCNSVTETFFA